MKFKVIIGFFEALNICKCTKDGWSETILTGSNGNGASLHFLVGL